MQEKGALEGIRVLDLGRVLSAPLASSMLGDMGAEVIKIETPEKGDDSRDFMPKRGGESGYFINFNRSQKGITLDLKKGKNVFLKMVRNSDVIVENFRPGVMKRLGLDYEELKKINPGIIYAAISGFGQTGPYSQRAGYDTIGQAMSGIMSVTGWPDSPPTRCGASFADVMAGMNAVIGILAALHYRSATGRGQMIDVALTDSAVVALSSFNQVYLTTGKSPVRMGNGYEASAPGGGYNAKDGYVVMGGGASPKNWTKLCEIMSKPEMITMPDFENNNARVKNRVKLDATIDSWSRTKTVDEILGLLLPEGFAVAPVFSIAQAVEDPHIGGVRKMYPELDHPVAGKMRVTGQAVKMSETNPSIKRSSPMLGEHNDEIYTKVFGFTAEEIENFRKEGIM